MEGPQTGVCNIVVTRFGCYLKSTSFRNGFDTITLQSLFFQKVSNNYKKNNMENRPLKHKVEFYRIKSMNSFDVNL